MKKINILISFICFLLLLCICLIMYGNVNAKTIQHTNEYKDYYKKMQTYHYCIYDVYNNNHLELMKEYIQEHTTEDIDLIGYYNHEYFWTDLSKDSPLMNCDIINMSLMTTFSYFAPEFNNFSLPVNLFEYNENIILVTSAGNYKDVSRQNIFTNTQNDNIYIVGQVELVSDSAVIHHYAVGEEIDFVVPNYNETKGTSAAAGYVSSLFINALEKGVPKNHLRDLLVFSGIYTLDGIDYRVLDMEKTEENIDKFINNETLNKTEYYMYATATYDKPLPYGFWIISMSVFIISIFIITLFIYLKYSIAYKLYLKQEKRKQELESLEKEKQVRDKKESNENKDN